MFDEFLWRGINYTDRERKDYSNLQNSCPYVFISERRWEKIAAELEPTVKQKRSWREGRGNERLNV